MPRFCAALADSSALARDDVLAVGATPTPLPTPAGDGPGAAAAAIAAAHG
ncbi:hypothetical protein I6A94_42830, partial [Frankia sp. CN4]|nr:hypothetical protein [Frankia nepalensis]